MNKTKKHGIKKGREASINSWKHVTMNQYNTSIIVINDLGKRKKKKSNTNTKILGKKKKKNSPWLFCFLFDLFFVITFECVNLSFKKILIKKKMFLETIVIEFQLSEFL